MDPMLRYDDLAMARSVCRRLKRAADDDLVSAFLVRGLADGTRRLLDSYQQDTNPVPELVVALQVDLNAVIAGPLIWDSAMFPWDTLTAGTRELLRPKRRWIRRNHAVINRLLLQDAYPDVDRNRRDAPLFGIVEMPYSLLTTWSNLVASARDSRTIDINARFAEQVIALVEDSGLLDKLRRIERADAELADNPRDLAAKQNALAVLLDETRAQARVLLGIVLGKRIDGVPVPNPDPNAGPGETTIFMRTPAAPPQWERLLTRIVDDLTARMAELGFVDL